MIEYEPDNASTFNNLANFYKEQGQTDFERANHNFCEGNLLNSEMLYDRA